MQIIRDFFILNWSESLGEDELSRAKSVRYDSLTDIESVSVVLATNVRNEKKFLTLNVYKEILATFEIQELKTLQASLLLHVKEVGGKSLANKIISNIQQLKKANVLSYEDARNIISILALIEDVKPLQVKELEPLKEAKSDGSFYENAISKLITNVKNLENIVELDNLNKRLENVEKRVKNASFSIGITGVMNAGKSTMLNALLGREVLGTSVVPETANLTVVKHSNKEHAVVNFWKENEWENIKASAAHLPSMEAFIKESDEAFGAELSNFITPKGKSQRVEIQDLSLFTSAKHSNKKCNLVKSVELFTDLQFIKNGVTIVDTPGLDDPVIQREEITKEYLSECDLMIHLMNVNQSATQKDVEFIIDALTYQSISRLLVVITRIDTVSEEELNEVIEYTKRSIKEQLTKNNQEMKFDSIIEKIDFLPIAGKMALLHRTGHAEKALKEGYDLEKSGILKIEEYLTNVLFGKESEKAKLLVEGNKKELLHVIDAQKEMFEEERENLSLNSDELKKKFDATKEKNEKNTQQLISLEGKINFEKSALSDYFETLYLFANTKLETLKKVLKQRVLDDASYEARKNKTKPSEERLKTMVEFGMKDGIVDLVRDYRYEFQKRMTKSMQTIEEGYEGSFEFNAKEYFDKNFSGAFLTKSSAILVDEVLSAVKDTKRGDIESLEVKLEKSFASAIKSLISSLLPLFQDINVTLLDGFVELLSTPLKEKKEKIKNEESEFLRQIKLIDLSANETKERLQILEVKLERLSQIKGSVA